MSSWDTKVELAKVSNRRLSYSSKWRGEVMKKVRVTKQLRDNWVVTNFTETLIQ